MGKVSASRLHPEDKWQNCYSHISHLLPQVVPLLSSVVFNYIVLLFKAEQVKSVYQNVFTLLPGKKTAIRRKKWGTAHEISHSMMVEGLIFNIHTLIFFRKYNSWVLDCYTFIKTHTLPLLPTKNAKAVKHFHPTKACVRCNGI